MDLDRDVVAERALAAIRQRYTPQRRALLALLARLGRPHTIPELAGQDAGLPLSSLYRNLTVLEQAGLVHRVVTSDEFSRYELSETLTGHHHHLVCAVCGGVEDFVVPPELEVQIAAAAAGAASRSRFHLRGHRFDLLGTCAWCADGGAPAGPGMAGRATTPALRE